jgi:hypothetical protein
VNGLSSILCLTLACWARAAGLSREEASQLYTEVTTRELPHTVDQAWAELDQATMAIRRRRSERLG